MSGSVGRAEAAGFQPAASPDPTPVEPQDNTTLVDARRAVVAAHRDPCSPQDVFAVDLVSQRLEPPVRIGLGRPVKHMLQSANPVPSDSRQGGPSRNTSTHRSGPFSLCVNEAAALPSPQERISDQAVLKLLRVMLNAGVNRWDRSVVWAILRNPAYAGTAVFGKTMATSGTPGLNRVARLQGRATPRAVKTVDRPREEWLEIPVPAIVAGDTFARDRQRLEDNKRFAARNTKVPSLLQGLAACSACGYGFGPEKITIRHRIPARGSSPGDRQRQPDADTEGDHRPGYLLRWGRGITVALQHLPAPAGPGMGRAAARGAGALLR